jgi:hypothetical protein
VYAEYDSISFLNENHVFESISRLFKNWNLKDVNLTVDIWLMKSIFDKIFDHPMVFLGGESIARIADA